MTDSAFIVITPESDKTKRRDFLYIATATFGAIGVAASLVPFISQMNPDASTAFISLLNSGLPSLDLPDAFSL